MKKVWNEEIERDLRAMEDFVLDSKACDDSQNLGKNLIADALGPDAAYSRFSPQPTKRSDGVEDASEVHELKTEIIDPEAAAAAARGERSTAKSDAPHDPIHDEKTQVVNTKGK